MEVLLLQVLAEQLQEITRIYGIMDKQQQLQQAYPLDHIRLQ